MRLIIANAIVALLLLAGTNAQAQLFDRLKNEAKKLTGNSIPFTEEEAAKALKEALSQGATNGSSTVSKVDGYLGNPAIRIPMPPEVASIESRMRQVGMGKVYDDAVTSLNRAAEDAAGQAKDILVGAVTKMTVSDAIGIVRGDSSAGTQYMRRTSEQSLNQAFTPVIKQSLEKVNATKYWTELVSAHNKLPFVKPINPDLTAYVTQRALDGLFHMIRLEEGKIRRDPIARTTDLLKKVFGGR